MEQLVKLVSEKAGITEAQAETAVNTVLGVLQDRLPAPLAGQVEKILAGESSGSSAQDLSGQMGKLFGG